MSTTVVSTALAAGKDGTGATAVHIVCSWLSGAGCPRCGRRFADNLGASAQRTTTPDYSGSAAAAAEVGVPTAARADGSCAGREVALPCRCVFHAAATAQAHSAEEAA